MNELTHSVNIGTTTMSSREIADLTGSRHDSVKRSAERLAADHILTSPLVGLDFEHKGNAYQEYQFNKRDSLVLVARLSPEFTAAVVDRWQQLEQAPVFAVPTKLSEALRLAANQADQIEHQQKALEAAKPAQEFVERYVTADSGSKSFRQVCKLLGANERAFRQFLADEKILYRLNGEWAPYQPHKDAGRFEVKAGVADNEHAFNSTKFTPKGVNWIAGKWAIHNIQEAA